MIWNHGPFICFRHSNIYISRLQGHLSKHAMHYYTIFYYKNSNRGGPTKNQPKKRKYGWYNRENMTRLSHESYCGEIKKVGMYHYYIN